MKFEPATCGVNGKNGDAPIRSILAMGVVHRSEETWEKIGIGQASIT